MKKNCRFLLVHLSFNKGFTLVEIILYMGLLAVLLLVLTEIFISILDVRKESEASSGVEQDGRFILTRLNYDIHRATSITTPALGFQENSLEIVISGISYTYSLNNNNLELNNNLGTNNLNSSETSLSNLTFQRIGNVGGKNTIKVSFTIESVTRRTSGSESKVFQTTVGLR